MNEAVHQAMFNWWMDYDEGLANFQDLPKIVEDLIKAEREQVLAKIEALPPIPLQVCNRELRKEFLALVAWLRGGEGRG